MVKSTDVKTIQVITEILLDCPKCKKDLRKVVLRHMYRCDN